MIANISKSGAEFSETIYDTDLERRLASFLHARNVPERESVHIEVYCGTVVVHGPMHSDHAKWLCIECCRHVAGVINLVDEIVVERPRKKTCASDSPPCTASKSQIASSLVI